MSFTWMGAMKSCLPVGIRRRLRGWVDFAEWERKRRLKRHRDLLQQESYDGRTIRPRIGIFKEYFCYHKDYINACRELGISYRLLNLESDNWIERVKAADCDIHLVWPSPIPLRWKSMFDDRIRFLSEDLHRIVYPSMKELWLYESKLRAREWLDIHGFPHPATRVFFDRSEALSFAQICNLPIVIKTESGGSANGIFVIRNRKRLEKTITSAFKHGLPLKSYPRERQKGFIYLQEYLEQVREWRMVRIGDSFFGYRKEPGADGIHSASHRWSWLDPPRALLDLTREVTQEGSFTSMNVDVFETRDGRYLINELQTVFGATTPADQLRVNDRPGRYLYSVSEKQWVFEEGDFSRNAVCNMRIEYILSHLNWCQKDF